MAHPLIAGALANLPENPGSVSFDASTYSGSAKHESVTTINNSNNSTNHFNFDIQGGLHISSPDGSPGPYLLLEGGGSHGGGGHVGGGDDRDAPPDPAIPQELEDVSRTVEKELKDAIESFMSKGHAALAPQGVSSRS